MNLLRPDDETLILAERDSCPFHIGALQYYDVPESRKPLFADDVRQRIAERLPATPLLCRLMESPLGFDSRAWFALDTCDLGYHVERVEAPMPLSAQDVHAFVERSIMQRLDLSRPPFRVHILDNLQDRGRCAILIKVHHAVADGIGFQNLLKLLTDAQPHTPSRPPLVPLRQTPPPAAVWLARSAWRLWRRRNIRRLQREARQTVEHSLAELRKSPGNHHTRTPVLDLPRPLSSARTYTTLTVELQRFQSLGKRVGGTVNDVFLTVCGGALRHYLLALHRLPDTPLVASSVRSYRRLEHGDFGNRIVALNPHIGTHMADPMARLRSIQQSMNAELARSKLVEQLLDREETPFGARKRKRLFAKFAASTGRPLPGNVTLSSVPGPAEPRYLAGYRQLSNYPAPILEGGRFLNITMRRNAGALDVGIMICPQVTEQDRRLGEYLLLALEELESASA
jgi:diacylglycerol O-acyltransferase